MAKEVTLTFWRSSVDLILPPSTINGAPDQMITADHIFMKILPEMYFGIMKSLLLYGSHPQSADFLQAPAIAHLTR